MKRNSSKSLLRGFCTTYVSSPCNSSNGKPIFQYICLPKLVSTEPFWNTTRTNTLLANMWSRYKLWIFKIHCPLPICIFFIRKIFDLSRKQCFSYIHKKYLLISRLRQQILVDWLIFQDEQLCLVHLNETLTCAQIFLTAFN